MVRAELKDRMQKLKQTPIADRIAAIKDKLVAAGDEAQELRQLPQWAAQELVNAGLYRFTLPTELAGEDLTEVEQIKVVEAVAAIDGSVGWCVQISSEINSLILRSMPVDLAEEVFDDWGIILCCGATPGEGTFFTPEKVDGGWRVSHRGTFGSSSPNATWTWVIPLTTGTSLGGGDFNTCFLVPKGDFEILDTWNTAGMRGSGSHDVCTNNVFVPDRYAYPRGGQGPFYKNTTYRNPTQTEYNKSAVALGVAQGTINAFIELSQLKKPWQTGVLMREIPEAQYRLGDAIATVEAGRQFLYAAEQALSDDLGPLPPEGNALPSWEVLRRARLACTHSGQTAAHIVDVLHNTSGTTASRMDSPLERRFRDGHEAAAHGLITYRNYRLVGASFMGVDPANASRGSRDFQPK